MPEVERRLMTRAEVAQLLRIPEQTLRNWRARGIDGPRGFKVGKAVRYRREEVDRWVAQQEASEPRGAA